MRKPLIIILLIALTLIAIFASSVFAFIDDNNNKIASLLAANSYEKALERSDVQKALDSKFKDVLTMLIEEYQAFGFKTPEEAPKNLGTPYKVYKLGKMPSYFWEIPLKDVDGDITSAIIVDKVKGNWEIGHVGLRFSPELLAFYCDDKAIKEYVSSKLNNVNISKIYRITDFYFDGIYVKANDQEYIIPITARPDLLEIQNMAIYTLDEMLLKRNNMLSRFSIQDNDH